MEGSQDENFLGLVTCFREEMVREISVFITHFRTEGAREH
jgi:hypothetical protein